MIESNLPNSLQVIQRPLVAILCYRTEEYLSACLSGLEGQSNPNFVTCIVYRRSTEERYQFFLATLLNRKLDLIVRKQEEGSVEEAVNVALECARGGLLILLDADAVPGPNFVSGHVDQYRTRSPIGGVAGKIIQSGQQSSSSQGSEVRDVESQQEIAAKFRRPNLRSAIELTRPCVRRFSLSGIEYDNRKPLADGDLVSSWAGANMSINLATTPGLRVEPRTWYGYRFEAQLGLALLGNKTPMVYSSEPVVYHIHRAESLTRGVSFRKRALIALEGTTFLKYLLARGYVDELGPIRLIEGVGLTLAWSVTTDRSIRAFLGSLAGALIGSMYVAVSRKDRAISVRALEAKVDRIVSRFGTEAPSEGELPAIRHGAESGAT